MALSKALIASHVIAESIGQGKAVNIGEVMRKTGYKKSTSLTPQRLTNTKIYKTVAVPLIEGLHEEITRIKRAIAEKDLSREEYRVLIGSLDVLTKNYQLLSGGATERQVFVMPSEILDRNVIESVADTKAISNDDIAKLNDGYTKP